MAGLIVVSFMQRALLRECGEEGCARASADMLELHSLMARRDARPTELDPFHFRPLTCSGCHLQCATKLIAKLAPISSKQDLASMYRDTNWELLSSCARGKAGCRARGLMVVHCLDKLSRLSGRRPLHIRSASEMTHDCSAGMGWSSLLASQQS